MHRSGPGRNGRSKGSGRGFFGKLDEVILGDVLGEMGWMVLLIVAVLAVIGLIWLFSLRA